MKYAEITEEKLLLILAALRDSLAKDNLSYTAREILEGREIYWERKHFQMKKKQIYHIIISPQGKPVGVGLAKRLAIYAAYCVCTSVGQQETMSSMDWWDRVNVQGYKYKKTMAAA